MLSSTRVPTESTSCSSATASGCCCASWTTAADLTRQSRGPATLGCCQCMSAPARLAARSLCSAPWELARRSACLYPGIGAAMDELQRLVDVYRTRGSASVKSKLDVLIDLERVRDPRVVPFLLKVLGD